MAYKARRTRDLQGEVRAGEGLGLTQTIKPDGTKVYTLENTAPGSEYFTTERTEGGWAILNQDNNIVIASSSGFDFNEKGVTFFTKDGEPFAIIVGTQAQGNQELKIIDANGNETIVIGTGGIRVNDPTNADKTVTLQPGIVQLTNEGGNTTVEISNSDIYIYNNDEGNENLIIEHSYDCKIYIRNRYGNDGVLIETYDDQPATVKICDQDGNEILNSESLVDMVNAIWSFNVRLQDLDTVNSHYIGISTDTREEYITPNNVRGVDYYELVDTDEKVSDVNMCGIKVALAGTYRLYMSIYLNADTSDVMPQRIMLLRNGTLTELRFTRYTLGDLDGEATYGGQVQSENILNLQKDDIIIPYWGDTYVSWGLETSTSGGRTYMITIQKLR